MTDSIEQEIKDLEQPLLVQLKLAPNEKARLARLAADSSCTESDYIVGLIRAQLNTRVGAAVISSATKYKEKITGPTGSVSRG